MANLSLPFLLAAISFGPCPAYPPSKPSPWSDTGQGPVDISRLPGEAGHNGDWLKKVCSDAKTTQLCDGYIRGLEDTLDFWKIPDENSFLYRMKYSDIQAGVRDYLSEISMQEAQKYQAPELLLCALNSKFPLFD